MKKRETAKKERNNKDATPPPPPSWRDALSGAAAGAFSKTVTAPIERLKLLLQLQQHSLKHQHQQQQQTRHRGRLVVVVPNNNRNNHKSAWQVAKSIYINEGLQSFWRGNLPSVMRVSGTAAINFTMMNYYKQAAVQPFLLKSKFLSTSTSGRLLTPEQIERRRKNLTSLISGGLAGGTSTTVLYPIEFLRTRLAADLAATTTSSSSTTRDHHHHQTGSSTSSKKYQFHGMRHAFTSILKSDGIYGFYQGYGIALVGGIFYRILFLGGYDVLKSETERYNNSNITTITTTTNDETKQQQQQQSTTTMESGGGGGKGDDDDDGRKGRGGSSLTWVQRIVIAQTVSLTAGTISYPLDSVRRRLMMQAGKPMAERMYRNSFDCITKVIRCEGIKGFYLGLGPNILRSVSGALLLVAYDAFREGL